MTPQFGCHALIHRVNHFIIIIIINIINSSTYSVFIKKKNPHIIHQSTNKVTGSDLLKIVSESFDSINSIPNGREEKNNNNLISNGQQSDEIQSMP